MPNEKKWMETVKQGTAKDVAFAKAHVERAEEEVIRTKNNLAVAQKQHACAHNNRDSKGVFGTTCLDCDYFFNDGGF